MKKGDIIDRFFIWSSSLINDHIKWCLENYPFLTICALIIIIGSTCNIVGYYLPKIKSSFWKSIVVFIIRMIGFPIFLWATIFTSCIVYCLSDAPDLLPLFMFPGGMLVVLFAMLSVGILTSEIYKLFEENKEVTPYP